MWSRQKKVKSVSQQEKNSIGQKLNHTDYSEELTVFKNEEYHHEIMIYHKSKWKA